MKPTQHLSRVFLVPLILASCLSAAFIGIGGYLHIEEQQLRIQKSESLAVQTAVYLETLSKERVQALINLMQSWPSYDPNIEDWFNVQANLISAMQKGYSSFVYADQEGIIRWVYAPALNPSPALYDDTWLGRHITDTGLTLGDNEVFYHALQASLGHHYVVLARKISPQEPQHGYLIVAFDLSVFLMSLQNNLGGIAQEREGLFNFWLADENNPLLEVGVIDEQDGYYRSRPLLFLMREWHLRIQTKPSVIPAGVFVGSMGVMMSLMISLILYKQLRGASRLSVTQRRYETASKAALDAIAIYEYRDDDFRLVEINPNAEQLFAQRLHELKEETLYQQLALLDAEVLYAVFMDVYHTGKPYEHTVRTTLSWLSPKWLKIQVVRAGLYLAVTLRDETERWQALDALKNSEEKYRRLIEGLHRHFVYSKTPHHDFDYVSTSVANILGFEEHTFRKIEKDIIFTVPDHALEIRQAIAKGQKPSPYIVEYRAKNGQIKAIEYVDTPVCDKEGKLVAIEGIARDVTQEQALQKEINYRATHDQLTGLLNRYAFNQQLSHVLDEVRLGYQKAVICFIDMDRFKLVNDSCGHPAGDRLLQEVASLFAAHVTQDDTLARLGGDEFCIIYRNLGLREALVKLDKLLEEVAQYRFSHDGKVFFIGASIGVVAASTVFDSTAALVKAADNACYKAKYSGRNRYYVYTPSEMQQEVDAAESSILSLLNTAVEERRLTLFCQPIIPVKAKSGGLHYEILLRLPNGKGEFISPALFIPLAERHGLMNKIDWIVVNLTLQTLESHPEHLARVEKVAINLSGTTLGDEATLKRLLQRVQQSGVAADKLCFEITETEAVTNLNAAQAFIREARQLGCHFALDDFGAGMSSFTYLKNLDVDYIKIDGSFVRNMVHDPIDMETVRAINSIAHSMGKKTVAEFVADDSTLDALLSLGVDYAQGFHLGIPKPLLGMLQEDRLAIK